MSYEAWRISFQSSEQAARVAYYEWQKWKSLAEANARGWEICQRRQERSESLAEDVPNA